MLSFHDKEKKGYPKYMGNTIIISNNITKNKPWLTFTEKDLQIPMLGHKTDELTHLCSKRAIFLPDV